jgi:hypothetical protein
MDLNHVSFIVFILSLISSMYTFWVFREEILKMPNWYYLVLVVAWCCNVYSAMQFPSFFTVISIMSILQQLSMVYFYSNNNLEEVEE